MRNLKNNRGMVPLLVAVVLGLVVVTSLLSVQIYITQRANYHTQIREAYKALVVMEDLSKTVEEGYQSYVAGGGACTGGKIVATIGHSTIPTDPDIVGCFDAAKLNAAQKPCSTYQGSTYCVGDNVTPAAEHPSYYAQFSSWMQKFFDQENQHSILPMAVAATTTSATSVSVTQIDCTTQPTLPHATCVNLYSSYHHPIEGRRFASNNNLDILGQLVALCDGCSGPGGIICNSWDGVTPGVGCGIASNYCPNTLKADCAGNPCPVGTAGCTGYNPASYCPGAEPYSTSTTPNCSGQKCKPTGTKSSGCSSCTPSCPTSDSNTCVGTNVSMSDGCGGTCTVPGSKTPSCPATNTYCASTITYDGCGGTCPTGTMANCGLTTTQQQQACLCQSCADGKCSQIQVCATGNATLCFTQVIDFVPDGQ